MDSRKIKDLEQMALRVRENIVRMASNGGCFIGSALSCADLMVYLYTHFLNISWETLDNPGRDYLFLSKGHAVPALYSTLVELGWLEKERLKNHLEPHDYIYWHPNTRIPGVEFHSGSLGHMLPIAVGVALDCKLQKQENRVVVMVGDGELNEGSNWEALLVARAYQLDNLVIVVDRNEFQANLRTEELVPLEPLDLKFEAFGCRVKRGNGHSFAWLSQEFSSVPFAAGMPGVVIAETVRGKGISSIENRADQWFGNFSDTEVETLIRELHKTAKNENNKKFLRGGPGGAVFSKSAPPG
jgi:transketolase